MEIQIILPEKNQGQAFIKWFEEIGINKFLESQENNNLELSEQLSSLETSEPLEDVDNKIVGHYFEIS